MEPYKPLEPLPSLFEERRRRRLRIFSWATVVAALCALAVGMLHAAGARLLDWLWLVWTGKP